MSKHQTTQRATTDQIEERLKEALAEFEGCVETPVVPGELPGWSEQAEQSCERLGNFLRDEIGHHHRQLFQEITNEDPALAPRVQEMVATDQTLLQQHHQVCDRCHAMRAEADFAEPHEARMEPRVEAFVEEAIKLVVAIRKQERAVTTWYQEAMLRDRGDVD